MSARVHPDWAGVLVADLGVAAGMGKHLVSSVLDDMSRDPADVAANLRALADVLDDGQAPRPEPVAVSRGGVTVGWRWPDGSLVEWDDDGNPVRSPQHGGHVEP